MKAADMKKAVCAAMAAVIMACMTSCGDVKDHSPAGNTTTKPTECIRTTEWEAKRAPDSEPATETETSVNTTAEPKTEQTEIVMYEAFENTVVDKYPDADYIESIADGRYVVIYRKTNTLNVKVYDQASDSELNSFNTKTYDTLFATPQIFYGKGFGFIMNRNGIRDNGLNGSYYDIDGNLVNEFKIDGRTADPNDTSDNNEVSEEANSENTLPMIDSFSASYTLAADGSAMYFTVNDRQQCACGFDFNPDFTTKVYVVHSDDSYDLITEFDHHTILYLLSCTDDGRLAVKYFYNPNDITVYDHDEYEKHVGEYQKDSEACLGFMSGEIGSKPEVEKVYSLDNNYSFTYLNNDIFTMINKSEIVRIYPTEDGEYKVSRFEDKIGSDSCYTELYISATGDYVVYPAYNDDMTDTTVNAVRFNGGLTDKVFEMECPGYRVNFEPDYRLTFLDEASGELFAHYDQEGVTRGQVFRTNINRSSSYYE